MYAGDPNVALKQIAESSEEYEKCYKQCERLREAISGTPEGSREREQQIERLNFQSQKKQQMLNAVKYICELYRTIPRRSPRMTKAERCFLKGDFAGMDVALPEEVIRAEIAELKPECDEYSEDWTEKDLLLRDKSYELVLKGMLHYMHTDNPKWLNNLRRTLSESVKAHENAHTLYSNGWFCVTFHLNDRVNNLLEWAKEFYADAIDERWIEEDLTDESIRFFEARCVRQQAHIRSLQNDIPAAIADMQQALALFTELREINPPAYLSDMAETLELLGEYHLRCESYTVALLELEESLRIRREQAVDNSEMYMPFIARTLDRIGVMHIMKGELRESIAIYEEAIAIERDYLEYNPAEFMDMLINSLNNLTTACFLMNRHEKLIPLLTETIALLEQLVVTSPGAYLPKLAHALCKLADQRRLRKEQEEAYRNLTEGITRYREAALRSPSESLPPLAERLSELYAWSLEDGKKPEAIAAIREAAEIYSRLANESPEAYNPKYRESLDRLAAIDHK
jgi:hypothetical protein